MVNKIEELESILSDLSKRKEKYEGISNQATKVIDELESKIMYAVRNSQNLPRTADISIIIQTFSQLLEHLKRDMIWLISFRILMILLILMLFQLVLLMN